MEVHALRGTGKLPYHGSWHYDKSEEEVFPFPVSDA
jgi:hypothetical protein